MKNVLILISILIGEGLMAQQTVYKTPKKNHYSKGKITLIDNQYFDVMDVLIAGDSMSYVFGFNNLKRKIPLSQVEKIKVYKGTKVLSGAIYGAIIPMMFMLEPLIDNTPNADNAGLLVAKVLVVSSSIGALIGSTIPVWKTYYFNHVGTNKYSLNYNLEMNSKLIGAQLVFKF